MCALQIIPYLCRDSCVLCWVNKQHHLNGLEKQGWCGGRGGEGGGTAEGSPVHFWSLEPNKWKWQPCIITCVLGTEAPAESRLNPSKPSEGFQELSRISRGSRKVRLETIVTETRAWHSLLPDATGETCDNPLWVALQSHLPRASCRGSSAWKTPARPRRRGPRRITDWFNLSGDLSDAIVPFVHMNGPCGSSLIN